LLVECDAFASPDRWRSAGLDSGLEGETLLQHLGGGHWR
jgi:hypothetical protein